MPMTHTERSRLILQLSDIHLFSDTDQSLLGLRTHHSFDAILDHVRQLPRLPEAILLTGDLSQDETVLAYQHLYRKLADFSGPIYWIPGNHDSLDAMTVSLNQPPFRADRTFALGKWHFLLLDSSMPNQVEGWLSTEKLTALDSDLRASAPHPTLIALHHPPFPIASNWLDTGLKNYEAFWRVLDSHDHVRLVLCGHIHQDFCYERRGVHYMSTPSTCVQFAPNSQNFAIEDIDPGFRLIELGSGGGFRTWVERVSIKRKLDFAAQGY